MTTSFRQRLMPARIHELRVEMWLLERGWEVCRFGQAQLSDDVRGLLRRYPGLPLRWSPDLLVVRQAGTGDWHDDVRLIDAKSGRTDTACYAVEKASLNAAIRWMPTHSVDEWLVFEDGNCCRRSHMTFDPPYVVDGPQHGNGSGTPYWLISKSAPFMHHIDEEFGHG